ncbi:hypothetical protein D3C85_1727040 [compost metagenome]
MLSQQYQHIAELNGLMLGFQFMQLRNHIHGLPKRTVAGELLLDQIDHVIQCAPRFDQA